MLEKDDGEDFIADIVEDVVAITLGKAYDSYISRQLLPFTINQAKDAILQIIEVHTVYFKECWNSVL